MGLTGASNKRAKSVRQGFIGWWGERTLSLLLRLKGHRILAQNLRQPGCEIDVISKYKNFIIFWEVKVRLSHEPIEPVINAQKKKLLFKCSRRFLQRYKKLNKKKFEKLIVLYLIYVQGYKLMSEIEIIGEP